jgi:hypothetical protein
MRQWSRILMAYMSSMDLLGRAWRKLLPRVHQQGGDGSPSMGPPVIDVHGRIGNMTGHGATVRERRAASHRRARCHGGAPNAVSLIHFGMKLNLFF